MTDATELAWFGEKISTLMAGQNLTREQARECWRQIIADQQPDLQQGAFIAALAMKGETGDEIAGSFEAIYEYDTNKVDLDHLGPLVENCGTGRDTLKTFNISTAASIIAAAGGVKMAKHGARGITSPCGTVDVLEAVGVDVECDVDTVKRSVERAGIGLFNGMSAQVHPRALFRILSQIRFGTTLHLAGSLANPARPTHAVRGVFAAELVPKTAETMRAIGYKRALVCHGWNHDRSASMDELSTIGETDIAELHPDGTIEHYRLSPEEVGIERVRPEAIATTSDKSGAARLLIAAIRDQGDAARRQIACLNAAAVLYIAGQATNLAAGYRLAEEMVRSGSALNKLRQWVTNQNRAPEIGLARFAKVMAD